MAHSVVIFSNYSKTSSTEIYLDVDVTVRENVCNDCIWLPNTSQTQPTGVGGAGNRRRPCVRMWQPKSIRPLQKNCTACIWLILGLLHHILSLLGSGDVSRTPLWFRENSQNQWVISSMGINGDQTWRPTQIKAHTWLHYHEMFEVAEIHYFKFPQNSVSNSLAHPISLPSMRL